MQSRLRSFTLVELLVVISIIGILVGLAVPVLGTAINSAKKAQAQSMIANLTVGITAFNTEYSIWPSDSQMSGGGGSSTDEGLSMTNAYLVLSGTGAGTNALNTRAIQFLTFNSRDLDKTPNPGQIVDPWYRSMNATMQGGQNYHIQVDSDYNNLIAISGGPFSGQTNNAGVAIWDPGIPVNKSTTNGSSTKALKNW